MGQRIPGFRHASFPRGNDDFSPDNQSVIIVRTVFLKNGENLSGNQSNSNSK
jgi:hypothetical protein